MRRVVGGAGRASAGFGLIEVSLALVVTSIGVLGAATVVLGVTSQARQAARDTDHALAGRSAADSLVRAGFASAVTGTGVVHVGGRSFDLSLDVTALSRRLKHVRVVVKRPPAPETAFEVMLAQPRPLPAAP